MAQVPIVRASDNRNGIIAAAIFLLTVLFLLFFITYSEPDPPKVTVAIPITMGNDGISDFEMDDGGGGAPADAEEMVNEPDESPQDVPTQEESEVTVEKGTGTSKTNTNTSKPEPSKPASPFGGSGSGGSGTAGSGSGFGSDDGPGRGSGDPGLGMAGDRIRLNDIQSKPQTPNDETVQIQLKVVVDSQGKVLHAESIRSGTTTTNQALINEVISLAKKEIRYKEKPGAANEVAYITVKVKPN